MEREGGKEREMRKKERERWHYINSISRALDYTNY